MEIPPEIHAIQINKQNRIVLAERIQVLAAVLFDGIAVEPATVVGAVEATLITDQARFAVEVFRAETKGELIGHVAVLVDDIAVRIENVLRGNRSGLGHIAHDIAVLIVAREVEHAVNRDGEKSSHATSTLFAAGKVIAPEVFDNASRAIGQGNLFEDDITAVIDKSVRFNHLPIIILTAKTQDEDRIAGLEVGADAYITKPFNMELLSKTVQNLLSSHDRLRNTYSGQQLPTDQIDTPESKSPDERLLERVIKVVNQHLNDPALTTDFIAREVGLSRVHLYRKLKELTNQSARDYVRNIRLAKAAELLSQKKVAVAEVANLVGFSNPNNFATAFRELYGMTPTQYMEQHIS